MIYVNNKIYNLLKNENIPKEFISLRFRNTDIKNNILFYK